MNRSDFEKASETIIAWWEYHFSSLTDIKEVMEESKYEAAAKIVENASHCAPSVMSLGGKRPEYQAYTTIRDRMNLFTKFYLHHHKNEPQDTAALESWETTADSFFKICNEAMRIIAQFSANLHRQDENIRKVS